MSTTDPAIQSAAPAGPWTVSDQDAALAHLDRLQAQIDSLRMTLPNLVAPLMTPQTNKAQMFAEIRKTAVTSTGELKQLRDDFTSERTREVFARARDSEAKDGDLSKGKGAVSAQNGKPAGS